MATEGRYVFLKKQKMWKASLVSKTPSTLKTWVSSAQTSLSRMRKKEAAAKVGSRMTNSRAKNSKAGASLETRQCGELGPAVRERT